MEGFALSVEKTKLCKDGGVSYDKQARESLSVTNDILAIVLGAKRDLQNNERYRYWNELKSSKSFDELRLILLSFFVSQALGIQRLPFSQDNLVYDMHNQQKSLVKRCLLSLSLDEIENILAEVKSIYQATQVNLDCSKVLLKKSFSATPELLGGDSSYNFAFLKYIRALQYLNLEIAQFETSFLNLFQSCHSDLRSLDDIFIKLTFDKEDIFLCGDLCENRFGSRQTDLSRGDWMVINRNYSGVVKIPLEDIYINESRYKNSFSITNELEAKRVVREFEPFQFQYERLRELRSYDRLKLNLRTKLGLLIMGKTLRGFN